MLKDGLLKLRRLGDLDRDYKLLEKWYQEKEVYSSFEQRILNYDEIKKKYFPRTLADTKIPVYMIEYDDNPIGIIQYQLIGEQERKLYNIDINNSYEIDIFIGELSMHNKGLGEKAINILGKYLFEDKKANLLVMCPLKTNLPAINCYKKCNFKIIKSFKAKDTIGINQEYLLMEKKNKDNR